MNHLDLFSGIGGFSLGLERAGFKTMAFCEQNEFCQSILSNNWPGIPVYKNISELCRRIHHNLDETGQQYDETNGYVECGIHRGWDFGDCDCIGTDQFIDIHEDQSPFIITAGVPCQPASIIGKRNGRTDDRWLWPDTFRVIEELEPEWVILENPTGLLTLDGGDRFGEIIQRLSQTGFDSWWETVPASAVGAGHRRERTFVIAHARGEGLEGHAGDGEIKRDEKQTRPVAPESVFPLRDSERWWEDKSPVQIVVDGVSDPALWKEQIIATGNSVVPQIPELIGRAIMEIEKNDN